MRTLHGMPFSISASTHFILSLRQTVHALNRSQRGLVTKGYGSSRLGDQQVFGRHYDRLEDTPELQATTANFESACASLGGALSATRERPETSFIRRTNSLDPVL